MIREIEAALGVSPAGDASDRTGSSNDKIGNSNSNGNGDNSNGNTNNSAVDNDDKVCDAEKLVAEAVAAATRAEDCARAVVRKISEGNAAMLGKRRAPQPMEGAEQALKRGKRGGEEA